MDIENKFITYVEGNPVYTGHSLTEAVRAWDAKTYNLNKSVAGGITVQMFSAGVMVRDGWVLHVMDDGTTYLNPNIMLK
jgi:hypothetical protein